MLGITSAKLTAAPGSSGWTQIYEFTPDDPEKLNLRGRLFAVVATKKVEDGVNTLTSGRELIAKLHTIYFENLEGKPFDALRNAIQKVASEFKEIWGDVEIIACSFVNGIVYSGASGGGRVVIVRDGALATILESSNDVISASGYPKNGDLMLLGTKAFFNKNPINMIRTELTSSNLETINQILASGIRGEGEEGTLGVLVMKFGDENPTFAVPVQPKPENQEVIKETTNFRQKLSGLMEKVVKKIPKRNIYIHPSVGDEVSSQSKKLTFSVGVILLIILIVSIGFGVRQKKVNDLKKKYQNILAVAQSDVDQAIGLASVSPDKSRELFLDSEQKLKEILDLKVKDQKVTDLQNKIEESRGAILGEYDGSSSLFLDLSLLSSGFKGDEISASGGNVFILDKTGKRIVSVAIDTKKSKVVTGPSILDSVFDIASYQDNVFALMSDGIYQVGLGKTKVIDKTWVGDAFISGFAGNLYVLDKSGNQIYRYSGAVGGTFGTQQNWLSASTKPNFANVVSWGMDGSIYVLYPNAKVLKFSLGSPQNFFITGVIPEIGNIDAIYADPDNQYIYLLDKAGKRVVVIDKKGKYKAQYVDDQIAGATSLVVSEAQKEIILLTGDKLLSIEIKHL